MFGLALMLGYLGFDGFTSTFQDKLFKVGAAGCVCGGACWLAVLFAALRCCGGGPAAAAGQAVQGAWRPSSLPALYVQATRR